MKIEAKVKIEQRNDDQWSYKWDENFIVESDSRNISNEEILKLVNELIENVWNSKLRRCELPRRASELISWMEYFEPEEESEDEDED